MPMTDHLALASHPGLHLRSGGWFLSRGTGIHPTRTIRDHELILVTSGSLHLAEGDSALDLVAGEWAVLRPGIPHRGTQPYSRDCAFIWLHFDLLPGKASLDLQRRGQMPRPHHAQELARRILDEHERPDAPALLKDLLLAALCCELAQPQRATDSGGAALAERAHRELLLRFSETISTADLAAQLGCHPDHLSRAYHQRFGHPPLIGLHRQRIGQARKLLVDTAETQDVIAVRCGYADVRHFRRLAGVTPGAWRNLHGRVHLNTE
jgi:AraC-like DNA-binding protein